MPCTTRMSEISIIDDSVDAETFAKTIIESRRISKQADDEAFYICDLGNILQKILDWNKICPEIKCFYAVKCNPEVTLLKFLAEMDINFDCASQEEIDIVLGLGVNPNRIVYSHPYKRLAYLEHAKESGVKLMVFDNFYELQKIHQTYGTSGVRLLLRIHVEDSSSNALIGIKFGVKKWNFASLLHQAKEFGLDVVGVAFHCGHNNKETMLYDDSMHYASEVFQVAKELGFNPNVIDIGGGFLEHSELGLSLKMVANVTKQALKKYFKAFESCNLQIIAEPGQFFGFSSSKLITKVVAKRKVLSSVFNKTLIGEADYGFFYIINDGIYSAFQMMLLGEKFTIPKPLVQEQSDNEGSNTQTPCIIYGETCLGRDKVMEIPMFPEVHGGDFLLWDDMGAYTKSMSTRFNGLKTTDVFYYISKTMMEKYKKIKNSCQK